VSTAINIRTAFISSILSETATRIRNEQQQVVTDWNLFRYGDLEKSVRGHFSVSTTDTGAVLTMRFLAYTRLLDMKDERRKLKREGYHLYNRIVFGNLYGRALPTLRIGLTEQVSQQLTAKFAEIMNMKLPYYKKLDLQIKEIANYDKNLAASVTRMMTR
jgi:hypothetical protein